MERSQCPPEEDILRAIATPHWDAKNGRLSHGFFAHDGKGDGISVSRLAVLDREALIEIFKSHIHNPPRYAVLGTIEINIGVLQQIGLNYREQPSNKPRPTHLSVVSDRTDNNPAHALIPEKITRGLSGDIVAYLEKHKLVDRWPSEAGDGT